MRDPFNAPVDLIDTDHRAGSELTRTNANFSARDYGLQNGDAKSFAPSSDAFARFFICSCGEVNFSSRAL
jgi:hypothetical protein